MYINGIPCLQDKSHAWRLQASAQPYRTQARLKRDAGEEVWRQGTEGGPQPVTVSIGSQTFAQVWILGEMPSDRAEVMTLALGDTRAWMQRLHIGPRWFNFQRHTGERRWVDGDLVDIAQIADDIDYAWWSIKEDGTRYKAWEMVEVVLGVIAAKLDDQGIPFTWEPVLASVKKRDPILESIILDEQAPSALKKVMQAAGCSYFQDRDGIFRCVDLFDFSEAGIMDLGLPLDRTATFPVFQRRAHVRPQAIDSLTTREQEVRFDGFEAEGFAALASSTDTPQLGPGQDPRQCRNMYIVNEASLTVGGQERTFGTAVRMDDALSALELLRQSGVAATPPTINSSIPLTHDTVRKLWTEGLLVAEYSGGLGSVPPSPLWRRRIQSIMASYRTLWQIPRHWRDRTFQIRPFRASIRDDETGSRAEAQAFADHAVTYPVDRAYESLDEDDAIVQNAFANGGQPADDYSPEAWAATNIDSMEPAVCKVKVVSQDLGLVQLDFSVAAQWGELGEVFPCAVKDNTIPHLVPDRLETDNMERIELAADHKVSFILSLIPAAPSGSDSLHRETIRPEDVREVLGAGFPLGACLGPIEEDRVSPHTITTMHAWDDDRAEDIERSFGIQRTDGQGVRGEEAAAPSLDDLITNKEHVRAVGIARAALQYLQLADRWEGQVTFAGSFPLRPTGSINYVAIRETPTKGSPRTDVSFASPQPGFDFSAFLSQDVRRQLGMQVTRGQGT